MSVLSQPHFNYEAKAFEFLESIVWAGGVVCSHCGTVGGRVYDRRVFAASPASFLQSLEKAVMITADAAKGQSCGD